MNNNNQKIATEISAKEVVLSFISAMNAEDFATAKNYTDEDLKFVGVMGSRNGAEAYFKDMRHMKFKYEIIKAFEEGEDVCVLYNIDMGGKILFTCGWYQVEDGKIISLKVVFDPRPLLEQPDKK